MNARNPIIRPGTEEEGEAGYWILDFASMADTAYAVTAEEALQFADWLDNVASSRGDDIREVVPDPVTTPAFRDRSRFPVEGDQTACRYCGMDIEYHDMPLGWVGTDSDRPGWIGRGGDRRCIDSGASGTYPAHLDHLPVSDVVS